MWFKIKFTNGAKKVYLDKIGEYVKIRDTESDVKVFEDVFLYEKMKIPFNINPKVIVDAGAYNGFTSVYFSSTYEDADIYAIEPSKENFEILKHNTKDIENIKAIKGALWKNQSGVSIQQNNPKGSPWSFETIEKSNEDEKTIDSFSIEDIMEEEGIKYIDLLKMDIEGAEKKVFEECEGWVEKVGVITVELHDRKVEGCSRQFYKAMSSLRFRRYTSGEKVIIRMIK